MAKFKKWLYDAYTERSFADVRSLAISAKLNTLLVLKDFKKEIIESSKQSIDFAKKAKQRLPTIKKELLDYNILVIISTRSYILETTVPYL